MGTIAYPGKAEVVGGPVTAETVYLNGFLSLTPQGSDPTAIPDTTTLYTLTGDEGLWATGGAEYPSPVRHGETATYSGLSVSFGSSDRPQYAIVAAQGIGVFTTFAYFIWPGTTSLGSVSKIVSNCWHRQGGGDFIIRLVDTSGNVVAESALDTGGGANNVVELVESGVTPLPAGQMVLSVQIAAEQVNANSQGRCASITIVNS